MNVARRHAIIEKSVILAGGGIGIAANAFNGAGNISRSGTFFSALIKHMLGKMRDAGKIISFKTRTGANKNATGNTVAMRHKMSNDP